MSSRTCAIVSFRLGLTDGVSVVAARWAQILADLGYRVRTVAGAGPVDAVVGALGWPAPEPPTRADVEAALADADLVVVENLLTIPLNLPASRVLADVLRGRPALLHHHDPPWQRPTFGHVTELPPDDPSWRHVTINRMTEAELRARGMEATTIYNPFDTEAARGDRAGVRDHLGVGPDELLVAHPVRAIPRKNVPVALRIAEQLRGTYWLLGPAEEDYAEELDWLLSTAGCRVVHRPWHDVPGIYAAADVVVFPSTWEGFGNPPVEASIHERPVVVGDYPVAREVEALGFRWFRSHQVPEVRRFLAEPDPALLAENRALARRHFSIGSAAEALGTLLDRAGWLP